MIRFNKISLSFAGVQLFNNLDFRILPGEHVCVTGDSGKGKSTILNLIQGYARPDSGNIEIEGLNISPDTIHAIRRKLIIIPQNINLPVLSGNELINLLELEKNRLLIIDYLEKLGLSEQFLQKSFQEISGGQKHRIVIAVCLSQAKEIILLDEPTASLDENSIELLMNLISGFKEHTVLSTSHNKLWLSKTNRVINL